MPEATTQDSQVQFDALVTALIQKRDVRADVTAGIRTAIVRLGMGKLMTRAAVAGRVARPIL
ncbi:MAG: hypothetical protein Q4P23_12670 [Micrococcaceae bacterium]|nr:hypothetical protein [Micrococcaceae bacterium]